MFLVEQIIQFQLLAETRSFLLWEIPSEWVNLTGVREDSYHSWLRDTISITRWFYLYWLAATLMDCELSRCMIVGVLLYIIAIRNGSWASGERTQLKLQGFMYVFFVLIGQDWLRDLALVGLLVRFVSTRDVIAHMRKYGPEVHKLTTGKPYGGRFNSIQLDKESAKLNFCAWKLIFENPRLAQRNLADNVEGKMTANQLNELCKKRHIQLWSEKGRHIKYGSPYCNGLIVYVHNGHATDKIPDNVKDLVVKARYSEIVPVKLHNVAIKYSSQSYDVAAEVEKSKSLYHTWRKGTARTLPCLDPPFHSDVGGRTVEDETLYIGGTHHTYENFPENFESKLSIYKNLGNVNKDRSNAWEYLVSWYNFTVEAIVTIVHFLMDSPRYGLKVGGTIGGIFSGFAVGAKQAIPDPKTGKDWRTSLFGDWKDWHFLRGKRRWFKTKISST